MSTPPAAAPRPDIPWNPPPSASERRARGREARQRVPRRDLGRLTVEGRDPLGILEAQNATRIPELVPLRIERMSATPFAFYRGAAAVMAADLARDPSTPIHVASCGDAHVANFGFYASPQRTLVFDLNDFDEAAWAPWEWDLKRLLTSVVLAEGETDRDPAIVRDAVASTVRAYVRAIAGLVERDPIDRHFEHFSAHEAIGSYDRASREVLTRAIADAERRTGARAVRRLTAEAGSGRLTFTHQPPTMTPVDAEVAARVLAVDGAYRTSANVDVRMTLEQYDLSDVARRVVGVGSVGTRCYLLLLQDGDGHAFVLQGKQAGTSVLQQFGGIRQPEALTSLVAADGEGARVVALQRVLQGVSDPFLGHVRGVDADFYVRQFHDMKGGIEMVELADKPFRRYAQACAITLARAHAQSPQAPDIAGYAGAGHALTEALVPWAFAYADLAREDHAAFVAAHA
ncbi:DUF2252 domain-containing protein [Microbacterium sp. Bi128]|uniref:DUF2252 domain-containing protein n=1 Tax=Microbacterium sp. Bi128 TaxID=2821115 RepID=UPI001D77900F|nr:DUF2252 domain-containing protein [Microbacterium sp. Bi128]CAH0147234.1 hypothetical protein SRABI128_00448 [Microbacterium sp. Bi128]